MRTKEIQYSRKFNLGNFETEDIGVVLELDEGEKAVEALAIARKLVLQQATQRPKPQSSSAAELEKQLKAT